MLRNPGHSLFKVLDNLNDDLASNIFLIFFIPVFMFAGHTSGPFFLGTKVSPPTTFINIIAAVVMEAFVIWRLYKIVSRRHRIREAYEAECAVGSELNLLMHDGAWVFHDLQGDNFNIDHVVVSSAGVFCIETKSRAKYFMEDGKSKVRVEFDGKTLNFPSHKETKPVEQVRRNAKWLKDWLAKASAEQVDVRPVLAFPGWWVENKSRSDVLLVSGKNVRGFLRNSTTGTPLNSEQIQRIVHQIEQRCRDIEPFSYPQKPSSPFAAK